MCINYQDRTWWKSFSKSVKSAVKKKDLGKMAFYYECYHRHMQHRHLIEYTHYKQKEFDELMASGKLDPKTRFFDWLNMETKKILSRNSES